MAELPELEVREAIVIRPGDHLIVRTDRVISMAQADALRHHIKGRLPLLEDVTVIVADGLAVFRKDASDA